MIEIATIDRDRKDFEQARIERYHAADVLFPWLFPSSSSR